MIGRVHVCCRFDPLTRDSLAKISSGTVVTLRGVVRDINDRLDRMVDSNVEITMRNCEVVVGRSSIPGSVPRNFQKFA